MQLFGKKSRLQIEKLPDGKDRLPPGQYLTKKWPVLSADEVPAALPANWKFTVRGLVEQPLALTWDEFLALPRITITTDIHCVTTWSRYDNTWEGVSIREILRRVKPLSNAHYVMAHSFSVIDTGKALIPYTTNIPLADLDDDDVLIALKHNGEDLEAEHGGPVRLVVPKLYFYKSAKWLDGLEFMEEDRPGFWEKLGYHNHADPWQEERYW